MEGEDEDLHHAASPERKLKVLNTNQKDTQVLNSAILQDVKENAFSKETFLKYRYIAVKFEQSTHEAGAVTVNQLVCTFLLLSKAASRNLARSGCSASDLALHEAELQDFISDSSSCSLSAYKWVGRERV